MRSIGQGIRTIVTVTERFSDLRTEILALRSDLNRFMEIVSRIAGRQEGIDQRFTEVDKRLELAVKLAVREEVERVIKPAPSAPRRRRKPTAG